LYSARGLCDPYVGPLLHLFGKREKPCRDFLASLTVHCFSIVYFLWKEEKGTKEKNGIGRYIYFKDIFLVAVQCRVREMR